MHLTKIYFHFHIVYIKTNAHRNTTANYLKRLQLFEVVMKNTVIKSCQVFLHHDLLTENFVGMFTYIFTDIL